MYKWLTFLVCALIALGFAADASAATCSNSVSQISGLDSATKQQMIIQCEQAKLEKIKTAPQDIGDVSSETVEKMDKWSEISLKFAKALGVAAKELGIAVNGFLSTPAGVFTATLLAWKILGATNILIFGICLMILSGVLRTIQRMVCTKEYIKEDGKYWNKVTRIKYSYKEMNDNQLALSIASYIIYLAVVFILAINLF